MLGINFRMDNLYEQEPHMNSTYEADIHKNQPLNNITPRKTAFLIAGILSVVIMVIAICSPNPIQ